MRNVMIRTATPWLVLLLMLALGTGCGSDSNTSDVTPDDVSGGDSADGDESEHDTADGEGTESLEGMCSRNADCGEDGLCDDGSCRYACLYDSDCDDPWPVCDNLTGRCAECRQDSHCPDEDQKCIGGRCLDPCSTLSDCPDDTWCDVDAGVCRPQECESDGDCEVGEICDTEQGRCWLPDCRQAADCPGGGECEDGRCTSDGPACSPGAAECANAQTRRVCTNDRRWREESCSPGACDGDGVCTDDLNPCGGAVLLPADPGDPCDPCGEWACAGANSLECQSLDDANACGGCGLLPADPGTPCSGCGTWTCDDNGGVTCDGPEENACGGCSSIAGTPGASCGTCGTYTCQGGDLECVDPGRNACRGCTPLDTFPGAPCDDPGEVHVCSGQNALTCRANTTNTCNNTLDCILWAQRFGVTNPIAIGCDPEVGCYLKGTCSRSGDPIESDPFGSTCPEGTFCAGDIPFVDIQAGCVGCDPDDNSTCRNGEVCRSLFGFVNLCQDPLSLPPGLPFPLPF